MTNTATLNLQTINQSNDFITNAKKALRADMINSRKLTLDSIQRLLPYLILYLSIITPIPISRYIGQTQQRLASPDYANS
nr:MAG TPA: hypothetical protein [Caudoviricetes sp.]